MWKPSWTESDRSVVAEPQPEARRALIDIARAYDFREDLILAISRMRHIPSVEEDLGDEMTRTGLKREAVEALLAGWRARQVRIVLTVVASEEAEEDEPPEIGLSSKKFWVAPGTRIGEAAKDAIETADATYFRFSFLRNEDSTEVWADWADGWSGDYASGVVIHPGFEDEILLDFMRSRLFEDVTVL